MKARRLRLLAGVLLAGVAGLLVVAAFRQPARPAEANHAYPHAQGIGYDGIGPGWGWVDVYAASDTTALYAWAVTAIDKWRAFHTSTDGSLWWLRHSTTLSDFNQQPDGNGVYPGNGSAEVLDAGQHSVFCCNPVGDWYTHSINCWIYYANGDHSTSYAVTLVSDRYGAFRNIDEHGFWRTDPGGVPFHHATVCLNTNRPNDHGTIAHELGHVLGLNHPSYKVGGVLERCPLSGPYTGLRNIMSYNYPEVQYLWPDGDPNYGTRGPTAADIDGPWVCNIANAGGLAYIYGVHGGGFGGSSAPTDTPTPTRTATPTPTITPTPTATPIDIDGDGFLNPQQTLHLGPANTNTLFDNCPSVYNPAQTNTDGNFIDLHVYGKLFDDLTVARSDALGDACDTDRDNDGIADAMETDAPVCASAIATGITDPLLADTDGDRVLDGAECALGTDPGDPASKPPASPPGDTDGDGLTDAFEAAIGTNPAVPDTDGDKIIDGVEYRGYNTNPLAVNTDGDACGDGKEIASLNADSVVNSIDQLIVAQSYGTAPGPPYRTVFDVNKDGRINSTDQLIQAQAWGYC